MNLPVIGVTSSRITTKYNYQVHSVAEKYVMALTEAGAAPLLVPLNQPTDQLDAVLGRLDGLLFTGGGDIHPRYFDAPLDGFEHTVDEDRDREELYLFHRALDRQRPFLGICRGLQLVNVGLGGTLYTDLLAQLPGAQRHAFFPEFPRDLLAHPVSITLGSRLHAILGDERVEVNSLHHQGVKTLAPGLLETACAPDGVVEGVELPDYPFGVAVQWHPEWLQAHAPMRALFEAFVNACRID